MGMGRHRRNFRSLFLEPLEGRFLLSGARALLTPPAQPAAISGQVTPFERPANHSQAASATAQQPEVEDESPAAEVHETGDTDDGRVAVKPPPSAAPLAVPLVDRTGGKHEVLTPTASPGAHQGQGPPSEVLPPAPAPAPRSTPPVSPLPASRPAPPLAEPLAEGRGQDAKPQDVARPTEDPAPPAGGETNGPLTAAAGAPLAGLFPLDVHDLEQVVDAFFAQLGRFGPGGESGSFGLGWLGCLVLAAVAAWEVAALARGRVAWDGVSFPGELPEEHPTAHHAPDRSRERR